MTDRRRAFRKEARPALVSVAIAVVVLAFASALSACSLIDASSSTTPIRAWEWPTYAHDAQHTGHGVTTLAPGSVGSLAPAWEFPTGDAVTATPTVVNGTVYAGSWDGWFYALDLETGRLLWKYQLQAQHAVTPFPGEVPRDSTSDGGLVTSSAWYQPGTGNTFDGRGSRPDLVIFGGGYTLYALIATTGQLFWKHDYTGRPGVPPDPNHDGTRIFSSPVVADGIVLFGVDTDGEKNSHGYVVGASLATGNPVWEYQDDVDTAGQIENNGCGNVWASGTLLPRAGLVVFDSADCNFFDPPPTAESVFALDIKSGRPAWMFRPAHPDNQCDFDFGASVNAGLAPNGKTTFIGVGAKDGTYYSIDPTTGRLRWSTNVVFGGFAGGFIASLAYDGTRVYGSTALGDFGRFEGAGEVHCDPGNPRDQPFQEPSVHAFDAATGQVAWQASNAASFGATTVAGGMTFNCPALTSAVQVRSASDGRLLDQTDLPVPCWSGIATVGNALVLGTGTAVNGSPDGIMVLTPGGHRPVTPASRRG